MALGFGQPLFTLSLGIPHYHQAGYPYDPALLYNRGRLFLYFGYQHCYVAELSIDDKRTVVKAPEIGDYISPDLLPHHSAWQMQNAPSIRRIGPLYYLSYYAVNNHYHGLCYSTSQSPFGPFRFQGVLISLGNGGVNGQQWPSAYQGNTHGGMVNIKGQWYQFYHRQTGGRFPDRQACMTKLTLKANDQFQTAEFKSQVDNDDGLIWNQQYPASIACVLLDANGRCKKRKAPYFKVIGDHQVVTNLRDGSLIGIKYLGFTNQDDHLSLIVKMMNASFGELKVFIDGMQHCAGSVKISGFQSSGQVTIKPGIHSLFFQFNGLKKAAFLSFQFCPREKNSYDSNKKGSDTFWGLNND